MRNKRSNYSIPKESSGCRRLLGVFLVISLGLLLTRRNSNSEFASSLTQTFPEDSTTHLFGTENNSKLLDGLLPDEFDSKSCLSRYESHLYRKSSAHKPSLHLISKLREYERLHRRCGPESKHYNRILTKLATTKEIAYTSETEECKYIVSLPINGLGNRMMSLASTFLYAILTSRVLLVAFEDDMSGLFCEPFLGSTWQLPHDFPNMHDDIDDLPTYASLVKSVIGNDNATKLANSMAVIPSFLHVNLQQRTARGQQYEKFFHCGEGQMILNKVPILILGSNQYYAPSLFMVPSFERDLNEMFPEKDTVFHHLGRYLFHSSNEAWSQITRFYKANLSKADKKVGIQVRVFNAQLRPAKMVMEQILACTLNNKILPGINQSKDTSSTSKAVLVTSLDKEYSENLSAIYKRQEAIRVYQPSHEKVQRFNNNTHNLKALTEMYLLSLCDELVTSGASTFGYVAQGLGGLRPWIMHRNPKGTELWDPPCERALSMEPCYPFAPRYDCERRIEVEHISGFNPHMRRCEDFGTGVKMVIEP